MNGYGSIEKFYPTSVKLLGNTARLMLKTKHILTKYAETLMYGKVLLTDQLKILKRNKKRVNK